MRHGERKSRLAGVWQRQPTLLRFLGAHLFFGVAVGIALAFVVATSNLGGMRTLLAGDDHPFIAVFMLAAMFALTFGSLAMGIAVMTLPWAKDEEDDDANEPWL